MTTPKSKYHISKTYPRCDNCNKYSYPSQERAMYAALIMAVKYRYRFKAYYNLSCMAKTPGVEIWHIKSAGGPKSTRARRAQRNRKRLKYGLSRRQVGLP